MEAPVAKIVALMAAVAATAGVAFFAWTGVGVGPPLDVTPRKRMHHHQRGTVHTQPAAPGRSAPRPAPFTATTAAVVTATTT